MDLARLEAGVRRVAEEIEVGGAARVYIGVAYPETQSVYVRRLAQADANYGRAGWLDLVAELRGSLSLGLERLQQTLYPECPPKVRRLMTMVASMAEKFL